ncbi:MAG: alanine--tRNA ligase [Myxococcota bacterium]
MSQSSAEIRRAFLDFFAARDHEVVPSAPLIPENDPTLMFVNAGMVPFKDVFTGAEARTGRPRAASSQKCIRISGKHNDLENVGVTARHHTFFEMLGNFSFGDYFKEQAIVHAWDLLVGTWDLDPSRLVVTVFGGEADFAPDEEAAALWKNVTGFGDDRVQRLGMADNFWSMGDTGPCGPCSEVHYFHGDGPVDPSTFGAEPGIDGRGWTEIWNLVFMQYDRAEKGGAATPLPAPCVDTGAGLERVAGVLQGVTSNYDTDLMRHLVAFAASLAGKRYTAGAGDDDVSMRVIADHARTTAFLMAEGVLPDKQARPYVLRRVMRRAIRHGHRLGIDDLFLHRVALEVVARMGDHYPELRARRSLIEEVTKGEEARFRATLARGLKKLGQLFVDMKKAERTAVDVATVADLYTTYGFPIDLTEVIARERGLDVDVVGARALVKGEDGGGEGGDIDPNAALDVAYREAHARAGDTVFTGYEHETGTSEVAALIVVRRDGASAAAASRTVVSRTVVDEAPAGAEVEVVVAATPFYAESGGQVGDHGVLRQRRGGDGTEEEDVTVAVTDTQRPVGRMVVHGGIVTGGTLRVGDAVTLEVDSVRRAAVCRNHSATHLLHWALRATLGAHAQQKGSLNGPDVLRFDFAHNQAMTEAELAQVERLVNAKVITNAPVETEEMSLAEARARGAMMIFEEKYGDRVRVVTMTPDSVELCGGTHVRRLGAIGFFKIVSEGGTAAGVRRIMAATADDALRYVAALEDELRRVRVAAKAATSGDLAEKVARVVQNERALQKRVKALEKQLAEGGSGGNGAGGGLDGMLQRARDVAGTKVLAVEVAEGTNMGTLVEVAEKLRDKLAAPAVVLVAAKTKAKASLALVVSKSATDRLSAGALIKPVAAHVGGSGGGRPDMARAGGANVGGLAAALAALPGEVAAVLGG